MAVDISSRRSRRSLITAALGGVAAAAAATLSGAQRVLAAGDDRSAIHVGDLYADIRSQTTLANQANDATVLYVASNPDAGHGSGTALIGYSAHGTGVRGNADNGTGVVGQSNNEIGVNGVGLTFAVYGSASDTSGVGAFGEGARGGAFVGSHANVRLVPDSLAVSHPAVGKAGDLYVDKSHRLSYCKGGTTWRQLA